MSYYMRYFIEGGTPLTLQELRSSLRSVDPAFRLTDDGSLYHGTQHLAELEITSRGDELFDEERDEFLEFIEDSPNPAKLQVVQRLSHATQMLAAQVLFQGRSAEAAVASLSPLWECLSRTHPGLLQVDGEGFYEHDQLVLSLA